MSMGPKCRIYAMEWNGAQQIGARWLMDTTEKGMRSRAKRYAHIMLEMMLLGGFLKEVAAEEASEKATPDAPPFLEYMRDQVKTKQ